MYLQQSKLPRIILGCQTFLPKEVLVSVIGRADHLLKTMSYIRHETPSVTLRKS